MAELQTLHLVNATRFHSILAYHGCDNWKTIGTLGEARQGIGRGTGKHAAMAMHSCRQFDGEMIDPKDRPKWPKRP